MVDMEGKLVSVIVPVYNGEKDLKRCIDSIVEQSYYNLQIILVDDGSRDSSGKICDEYAKKDKRIEVIHISNGGVSNARNIGLKRIKGEFIQFVDSDDYLEKEMIYEMLNKMDEDTDWCVCRYYNIYKSKKTISIEFDKKTEYDSKEYLLQIMQEPYHYYYGVLWNKLYKSEIIKKNALSFDINNKTAEDFLFNLEYLKKIQKIKYVNMPLYNYNQINIDSLTRSSKMNAAEFMRQVKLRIYIYEKYKETYRYFGIFEKYKNQVNDYLLRFYWKSRVDLMTVYTNLQKKDRIECRKYLKNHNIIHQCKSEMTTLFFVKRNCHYIINMLYYDVIKDGLRKWLKR